MEHSESIAAISKALVGFQADVKAVPKTATNPFYSSKYAPLDAIIETIKEPMRKHGLSLVQLPDDDGLTTILAHTSGEFFKATAPLNAKDGTPQAQGSAITYMRRYALSAALGLATEDDDDGNSASRKAKASPTRGAAKPKAEPKPSGIIDTLRTAIMEEVGGDKAKAKARLKELTGKSVSTALSEQEALEALNVIEQGKQVDGMDAEMEQDLAELGLEKA
jgi:hypothetical protein